MRLTRLLVLTAAVFLVSTLALGLTSPTPTPYPPWTSSVVKLQDTDDNTYCTAFVISKAKRFLMTADHCMVGEGGSTREAYVNGYRVKEIFHIPGADIAVLEVASGAVLGPPIAPDTKPITQGGEEFWSAGYSGGRTLSVIKQEVAFPTLMVPPMDGPFVLYFPAIRFGMSGGPIIRWNKQGPVSAVGVNSMAHQRGRFSITRPLSVLYDLLKDYYELPPVAP